MLRRCENRRIAAASEEPHVVNHTNPTWGSIGV
jgi:hypothetical protein